jgi:hypothetical protein
MSFDDERSVIPIVSSAYTSTSYMKVTEEWQWSIPCSRFLLLPRFGLWLLMSFGYPIKFAVGHTFLLAPSKNGSTFTNPESEHSHYGSHPLLFSNLSPKLERDKLCDRAELSG